MEGPQASLQIARADPRSGPALGALREYVNEMSERSVWKGQPDETEEIDEFVPPGGGFVLASDGEVVIGCGGIRTLAERLGEIKRMWVSPNHRRRGVASAILDALEMLAVELGHDRLRLDTNAELIEALAFYRQKGFQPIERYNDSYDATDFFEKRLARMDSNHH